MSRNELAKWIEERICLWLETGGNSGVVSSEDLANEIIDRMEFYTKGQA